MCSGAVVIELVSVVAEEDEVSLVMPCYHSSLLESWILREQTRNESAHSGAQHCVEIIEDQLWCHHFTVVSSMIWNVCVELDSAHSESRSWTIWKMSQDHAMWFSPLLLEHHDIGKIFFLAPLNNFLDSEVLSRVVLHIWDGEFEFLEQVEDVSLRSSVGRH